ncbi:Transcriptional regulator, MarR family [Actinomycetales bacterium JB111]|nr:Transcriptional regulator, MarR family [Actinomycetales bacterium JB111]
MAIARLRAMGELLPTALDRRLTDIGITSFEFMLLEALAEAEDRTLRMTALALRTNATLPRLSRVVSSLERKGLIVRSACESDRRATNATLTDDGVDVYREALPIHTDAVRTQVLGGLGEGGAGRVADLALSILATLDPDRTAALAKPACNADPEPAAEESAEGEACAADPAPAVGDGAEPACAADPVPARAGAEAPCPADPVLPGALA